MAILVFEHSDEAGILRLGRTLRNYGHRLRIVRLHAGDPIPPDLDDIDGIITCGGPQSANDDSLEWIDGQMGLIRQAHEKEMPVIGICLGSQIVARALGGTVESMESGPEIGWYEIALTPAGREDPIHTGLPWRHVTAHWHHDHVSELPPGARLLATSDHCKVQAWSMGIRTYAFQTHPEFEKDTLCVLAEKDQLAVQQASSNMETLRLQSEKHYPAFERLTDRMFESIALFLMPVDRRYQGLVKDLHH